MRTGALLRRSAAPTLAVLLALLVLGPALGPGLVLTYDMVFVPDAGPTPYALGADVPAARAVPSDAIVALASVALPTPLVQKLVLVGVLAGAGLGCARLVRDVLPGVGGWRLVSAEVVAVVVGQWNPFVLERLVLGQWTVLLGLALLPWAGRAALRARGEGGALMPVLGWNVAAAAGGASTALLVLVPCLVVLAVPAGLPVRLRSAAVLLGTAVLANASWWLPSLARAGDAVAASATTAFTARADTPLGLVPSLVTTGGIWNPAVVPGERGQALVVVVALLGVLAAVGYGQRALRRSWAGAGVLLLGTALAGVALVALASAPGVEDPVASALAAVPGGGLLRDGQKLLAWWVVAVAVCAGAAVARAARAVRPASLASVVVVLAALVPVVTLPSLGWGAGGRLDAVDYPEDVDRVRAELADAPAGAVASLPWNQYRRHAWNGGGVSLDPAPRLYDRAVVFDDSLPLRAARVAGEDPRAQRIRLGLEAGEPVAAVLGAAGVRFVVLDIAASGQVPDGEVQAAQAMASGTVLHRGADLMLVDLGVPGGSPPDPVPDRWGVAGLVVSGLTALGTLVLGPVLGPVLGLVGARRRRRPVPADVVTGG